MGKKIYIITILSLLIILIGNFLFPKWITFLITISLSKALVVLGIIILMRSGLVSFGQGLFYCIGGYVAGMSQKFFGINDFFLILIIGIAVSIIIATIIGILLCNYRDIFFAMFTLAFSMILYGTIVKTETLGSTDGFNVLLPSYFTFKFSFHTGKFLIILITLLITWFIIIFIKKMFDSEFGFISLATKDNEIRVEYLGTSPKIVIFINYIIAAVLATIGGTLTAFISGHVDPNMAYWTTSGEFVFVALLGGTMHVLAPFIASILFEFIHMYAYSISPYTWHIILGSILLLIIIFLPEGLWSIGKFFSKKEKLDASNS